MEIGYVMDNFVKSKEIVQLCYIVVTIELLSWL